MTSDSPVRLSDEDPDLFRGLPERLIGKEPAVRSFSLTPGPWTPTVTEQDAPLGLLVVNGLLARNVHFADTRGVELLGPTDSLRPWVSLEASAMRPEAVWQVLEPVRIAVLGRRFFVYACQHPSLISEIMDRLVLRSRWLAFHLAVRRLKRLESRIITILWFFADRWGRVTPEGIVIPLTLNHGFLAAVVGAERPSVTTALSGLTRRGMIERTSEGFWTVHDEPPPDWERIYEAIQSDDGAVAVNH